MIKPRPPMNAATKEKRKDLADAFRAALKYLSPTSFDRGGKYQYICWAIDAAFTGGRINRQQRVSAKKVLSDFMEGDSSLRSWLDWRHPELAREIIWDYEHSEGQKLQATRRAWLKSLIKEFS